MPACRRKETFDQPYQKLVGHATSSKWQPERAMKSLLATQTLCFPLVRRMQRLYHGGSEYARHPSLGSHSRDTMVAGILTLDDKAVLKRPSISVKVGALMILCRKKLLSTQMARKNRKEAAKTYCIIRKPSLRP